MIYEERFAAQRLVESDCTELDLEPYKPRTHSTRSG
jgi:hypothetical protein